MLQVVKGTRKTYQKTTAQRSKHNGLREREEDAADCTSRLKMDAFPRTFFIRGFLFFIGVKKIVLSMKENMRFHELSVLAKKDIQCIWREKPSKDLVWKLFPLVGRCPYSVTGFGERRNLGFMVKAHAAVWGNQGLLSGPQNSAPIGLIIIA